MKALTLHQPWATAIAIGMKKYETRPRSLKYRGPIAIHAGKRPPDSNIMSELSSFVPFKYRYSWNANIPLGAVVAIGEMTDCIQMDEELIRGMPEVELRFGHWEPGRYAYKIENVTKLSTPVEIGGAQGLWNLDDSILDGHI